MKYFQKFIYCFALVQAFLFLVIGMMVILGPGLKGAITALLFIYCVYYSFVRLFKIERRNA